MEFGISPTQHMKSKWVEIFRGKAVLLETPKTISGPPKTKVTMGDLRIGTVEWGCTHY